MYNQIAKTTAELGSNCAAKQFHHFLTVVDIDGDGNFSTNTESRLQGFVASSNDYGRMDISGDKRLGGYKHFSSYSVIFINIMIFKFKLLKSLTQDNNRSGAITHFLILSSGKLNHAFGSRM